MGIAVYGKDEKIGIDTRCRAVVRTADSEEVAAWRTSRDRGRENARWQVCAFFRKRESVVRR